MTRLIIGSFALLAGCSSSPKIDPQNWSCEQLVKPVIEMSQERELKILEITQVKERQNLPGSELTCSGNAEWSQGDGWIEFGARISDGDQLILEYSRD
jgi:hypothetical protein